MFGGMVKSLLVYVLLVFGSHAQSATRKVCPPVALSLVLDGSGSIEGTADRNCQFALIKGKQHLCKGNSAMKKFAKGLLDIVRAGPNGDRSQYSAVEFDYSAKLLSAMNDNVDTVKQDIDRKYLATDGDGTYMASGIIAGHEQLKGSRKGLAKVMLIISDGKDTFDNSTTHKARIQAATAAKNDGITIFAYGFAESEASSMRDISGNKNDTCKDCSQVVNGSLSELEKLIEDKLCKKVTVAVPPTPSPTAVCRTPKDKNRPGSQDQNKDNEWSTCHGNLCKYFPYSETNGSSALCLQLSNAGACEYPKTPYYNLCSCTCGVCCELTPEPTPAPTSIDSPTNQPSPAPTFPDCKPEFNLTLQTKVKWLQAKDTLVDFFTKCGYDFDSTWNKMVQQYFVKVERGGNFFAFDGPDGIAKSPLTLHVCMPADFSSESRQEKCKESSSLMQSPASLMQSPALARFFGFIAFLRVLTL